MPIDLMQRYRMAPRLRVLPPQTQFSLPLFAKLFTSGKTSRSDAFSKLKSVAALEIRLGVCFLSSVVIFKIVVGLRL